MRPDHDYTVIRQKSGNMFRAGWHSVWSPLLGVEDYKACNAQTNWDRVRRMWRTRLEGLRQEGWEPALKPQALYFMRNCPPFGVLSDHQTRVCHKDRLCPFCWSRYTVKVYHRATRILHVAHKREACKGFRLLAFVHKENVARCPDNTIDELVKHLRDTRDTEIKQIFEHGSKAPFGSFVLQTVEIYPKYLTILRRGLIITRGRHKLRPAKGLKLTKPILEPSRTKLAKVVGKICRYPVRQITCSALSLKLFLDLTRKYHLRLTSFKGAMRQ